MLVFCFSQDGDIDRERRFESSKWQSFQPIVILKGLSPRERAQYGLRGDRIGEAKNPGPPSAVGDLDQAMEFDLTLRDSTDEEVQSMDPHDPPCGSLSDTESVRPVPQQRRSRPRRRLRLTWQVEQGADTAHRDVRAASQLVEALARRVGCIPDGAPLSRAIQQQR